MKSNVIRFPSREKEYRDQVLEIKEELVNGGHFDSVADIPTSLILFIVQYWQEIHDTGTAIGKTEALNMMLSSSSRLPMNEVEDLEMPPFFGHRSVRFSSFHVIQNTPFPA